MSTIKILMASAEATPFAKVGGLADVVGSLPKAIKKLGHDVRLIIPLYGSIDRTSFGLKKINSLKIKASQQSIGVNIWRANLENTKIPVYFIEAPKFFRSRYVYLPNGNNTERFLFFSLAVLEVLPIIKFQPDIIHCHDVHTAIIPDLLAIRRQNPFYQNIKTLYTIHNLYYQGISEVEALQTANLSPQSLPILAQDAKDNNINFMVQGILGSDLINTVSPTYAREITTSVYGAKLESVLRLRRRDLFGILNGLDTDKFNPATDKAIEARYSVNTLTRKQKNKIALQKRLNLPLDPKKPIIGFIARLVWQKGLDLFTDEIMQLKAQFVFLGTGKSEYENHLRQLEKKYPNKVKANIFFDPKLAQQIYAGADILAVPSRFEPCGLTQMIAMRYGTIPVVRAVGGLKDTVDKNVGWRFFPFSVCAFRLALSKAINTYLGSPKQWQILQKNGMKKDFSWRTSARKYEKLYKILGQKRFPRPILSKR